MSDCTAIEWTDATWNPIRGCSKISPGCEHCYAIRQAIRQSGPGGAYEGLVKRDPPNWTGIVSFEPKALWQPTRWRKPRRIFVGSMSDLFHPAVTYSALLRVFKVMLAAPQHTYQILTKRPEAMCCCLNGTGFQGDLMKQARIHGFYWPGWPLPNVWLGVSVEDQQRADERLHDLLRTPAAVHWISAEPLLGELGLAPWIDHIDWIVAGGETGPRARPMHPDWIDYLCDQAVESQVPFFFKHWGEYDQRGARVGRRNAGRLLDGRTWDEMPGKYHERATT